MTIPITTAHYAAVISTILLVVKFYEMYQSRFKFDAYLSVDGAEADKDLVVTNLTNRNIHIKNVELYFSDTKYCSSKEEVFIEYYFISHLQIQAHSFGYYRFRDEHDFNLIPGKNLYATFTIVGRSFQKTIKIL